MADIVKLKTRGLRSSNSKEKGLSEKDLHKHIQENPEVLGIPGVKVRASEKPSGRGRLDLLLEAPGRIYVVEIQRGQPDESHIVRLVEYLASEQKQSGKLQHYAVIVAENIVQGRFCEVLRHLNEHRIPLIAIEATVVELPDTNDKVGFVFTRVLDFDLPQQPASEKDWRSEPNGDTVVGLVNKFCKQLGKGVKPYFTKHYAGMDDSKNGRIRQCQIWRRKDGITVYFMSVSPEWDNRINRTAKSELSPEYNPTGKYYRFSIGKDTDMKKHADLWRAMYCEAAGIKGGEKPDAE
ncbi:MAG: hypothetical protein ACR2P4_10430 [Gammaproteobacteria bacterium]